MLQEVVGAFMYVRIDLPFASRSFSYAFVADLRSAAASRHLATALCCACACKLAIAGPVANKSQNPCYIML